MLEVLPVGISKGKALAYVAQLHGFDMQSVLAMGDGENDISMLSSSGVRPSHESSVRLAQRCMLASLRTIISRPAQFPTCS